MYGDRLYTGLAPVQGSGGGGWVVAGYALGWAAPARLDAVWLGGNLTHLSLILRHVEGSRECVLDGGVV